jgi:hypothetical protein
MNDHTRVDELEHIRIVAHANSLAHDFFRGIYGESAIVPDTAFYELQAYPCWALACHAYQELLGIDPRESLRKLNGDAPKSYRSAPPDGHDWKGEVIENARRIEREIS